MRKRASLTSIFVLALVCASSVWATREAWAKQHRFVGEHPIAGGGYCYIEAPHVHVYPAVKAEVLFRDHDGWQYYAGDPVAYGYDGPTYAYHGAHPIYVDAVVHDDDDSDSDSEGHGAPQVEYCYISGPHYHDYEPAVQVGFTRKGNVYWYVGEFPPVFVKLKPRYMRINAIYQPIRYARPVVEVAPPPEYHDVLVVPAQAHVEVEGPAPPVVRAGVEVDVHIPVPVLEVHIGGDGGVRGRGHGHGHGHGHARGPGVRFFKPGKRGRR